MDIIVLIGRVLFAFLFIMSGIGHLMQRKGMGQYAAAKGVPAAELSVVVSGLLLLAGGLSVLLGIWADLGALLLVIFLVPTAVLMHGFWKESDPQAKQMEMIQFNKDMGLAGAALMLLAFFSYVGSDLGLTLTGPLFSIR